MKDCAYMLVDWRPLSWSGTADLRNTPPRGAIRAARGGASLTVAPAVDGARLAVLIADPPNPLPVAHRVVDILRTRMLAIACS